MWVSQPWSWFLRICPHIVLIWFVTASIFFIAELIPHSQVWQLESDSSTSQFTQLQVRWGGVTQSISQNSHPQDVQFKQHSPSHLQSVPSGYPNLTRYPVFLSISHLTRFSFGNHWVSGNQNIGYYPIFWVSPIRRKLLWDPQKGPQGAKSAILT